MASIVTPPPYVITPSDKRGVVVVVTAASLSFVWACFLIRLYLRWRPRQWVIEDYFVAAATVLDTGICALIFHTVGTGLGQSVYELDDRFGDLYRIGKDDFAIQILYIITLLLSKVGVLSLYLRLSPKRGHVLVTKITILISAIWALVAIILIAAPCAPSYYWPYGLKQCTNVFPRWVAIVALDILTELIIFGMSIYLVANLHMKTLNKVMVVAAFSLRFPAIAASAARVAYIGNAVNSKDPPLYAAYYMVCTQAHLSYAIMSATLTSFGQFLRPFVPDDGAPKPRSGLTPVPDKSPPGSHNTPDSYRLRALNANAGPKFNSSRRESGDSSSNLKLRPEGELSKRDFSVQCGNAAQHDVLLGEDDSASRVSDDSQKMIITKRMEITVEMERASLMSRARNGIDSRGM
ncbi:hypothetical protein M011DRAFT_473927 [Sporormia fimetaria CBS 119925]|uniref:Rhodopsin domain-containing protein n=1 Tax=Sporormia fimetaria CBS 119925 TaxID=1340428 RepID=A0A6A6VQ93_9PLEO|nr:hypothetical protein M011DRAFT_473927 [Sporormia fimetaria CBS 119925]